MGFFFDFMMLGSVAYLRRGSREWGRADQPQPALALPPARGRLEPRAC
jgi:hypothetical protein